MLFFTYICEFAYTCHIYAVLNKLFQLFGSRSLKEIKRLLPIVADINAHFRELEGLSNDALREASRALKEALATAV